MHNPIGKVKDTESNILLSTKKNYFFLRYQRSVLGELSYQKILFVNPFLSLLVSHQKCKLFYNAVF